ncbi:MAG: flagellar basal body-associated FliL family protein [candidate division FCPU426 bacterium]
MDKDKNASTATNDPSQQIKLLLIVVLVAAVIAPLISSLVVVGSLGGKLSSIAAKQEPEKEESGEEGGERNAEAQKPIIFYEPMEFLVNLADTEANHYLKTTVSLGARIEESEEKSEGKKKGGHGGGHGAKQAGPQPALFQTIKAREPMIRDLIISVISAYPMAVLVSVQGKRELKEALSARLQQELGTSELTVYFTSFTLQ